MRALGQSFLRRLVHQIPQQQQQHLAPRETSGTVQRKYRFLRTIGKGAFGEVFECEDATGTRFAIKKVLQDPQYTNRELEILRQLHHPNCLALRDAIYCREGNPPQIFLYVVTDVFPQNLSEFMRQHPRPPVHLIKLFTYQIFKALAYMHSKGICHRDIKPSNVLVDQSSGVAQLCDFGSAKLITANDESVVYIATRNYRAPELLFQCPKYGSTVDIWAAGCVAAEMLNGGRPIFIAGSNAGMIGVIARMIGSPNAAEMADINGQGAYTGPLMERKPLRTVFPEWAPPDLIALLEEIFVYSPKRRLTAVQALQHPYFAEVREGKLVLPNGQPLEAVPC